MSELTEVVDETSSSLYTADTKIGCPNDSKSTLRLLPPLRGGVVGPPNATTWEFRPRSRRLRTVWVSMSSTAVRASGSDAISLISGDDICTMVNVVSNCWKLMLSIDWRSASMKCSRSILKVRWRGRRSARELIAGHSCVSTCAYPSNG